MSTTHSTVPLAPAPMYQPSPDLVASQLTRLGARRPAVIIVASDGTERSEGALRVALARAEATGAALEVLTIAQAEPIAAPEGMVTWQQAFAERRAAQRSAVERQLEQLTGRSVAHGLIVLDGHPAYSISRVAIEHRAALVIVGLGRHELADRLFSDETALQLARISRVPVLAVPQNAVGAGTHAIVAIDFGELSRQAAQAAIDAVGDDGIVELVHVAPYMSEDPFAIEDEGPHERWAKAQLEAVRAQLAIPRDVSVSCVLRRGRPARELLAYARQSGADFIATGTHGHGFIARAVLGSVATQLIRGATCAVLSIPRDPLPALDLAPSADAGHASFPDGGWVELLATFSKRNAGRRTILEVDDRELGAQAQEYNYPLLGTTYDERSECVELMLGDAGVAGRHLTRRIGGVVAVDVLSDADGLDVALRVQHGTSQTLLTFAG